MRNFAANQFRLGSASFEVRLVYSLFLLFIIGGMGTIWYLQFDRVGFRYDRVVAYYLGGEIDGRIFFPKNLNASLEESHFHAFSMSVVFLILSHLFLGTRLRNSTKLAAIVATFCSHTVNIAGTWLLRLYSPLFAYALMVSWTVLWIGYGTMIFVPLYEMWVRRNAANAN